LSAHKGKASTAQFVGREYEIASGTSLFPLRSGLDGQNEPKIFAQYPSHRIFRRMYGALNIVKKNN
jgi:hypothetical protein